jgi:hypothetical protein
MIHKARVIGRRSSRAVSCSAAVALRTERPSSPKETGAAFSAGATCDARVIGAFPWSSPRSYSDNAAFG